MARDKVNRVVQSEVAVEPVSMLLAMSFRAMTDHIHTRLREMELEPLRPAHGFVFRFLADRHRTTAMDLAAHLGVTKQAAAKIVAELVEWGYLRRGPHPTDKRAQVVALTAKGRDYLRLADNLWVDAEAEMAAAIGAERLGALREDLARYLRHVHGDTPQGIRPVW